MAAQHTLMDRLQIQTAQNVDLAYEVAGVGDRVIAALVDYALIACYYVGAGLLLRLTPSIALAVVLMLPPFFYFLLCEVFLDGQSIGKRLRDLRVVHLDGTPPTLGSYLLRWILRPIDLSLTFGAVALLTVLINGKGQRLGDLAAGTTVVKLRREASLRDTIFTPVEEEYTPVFHQVDALTDRDITTAKEVLDTLTVEPTSRTTYLLGNKIKAALERKMGVSSDLSPPVFLKTVVRDYNHRHGQD